MSELLDSGARALLARAYAAKGGWVTTRLADPSDEVRAWAAARGLNPGSRDNPSSLSGARSAKTRWGRAMVRALYYNHRWYGAARPRGGPGLRGTKRTQPYSRPLEVQVGRHVPAGVRVPAGRLVRCRLRPGGQAARRAVQAKALSKRIYDDDGRPAARWSDPGKRDWA